LASPLSASAQTPIGASDCLVAAEIPWQAQLDSFALGTSVISGAEYAGIENEAALVRQSVELAAFHDRLSAEGILVQYPHLEFQEVQSVYGSLDTFTAEKISKFSLTVSGSTAQPEEYRTKVTFACTQSETGVAVRALSALAVSGTPTFFVDDLSFTNLSVDKSVPPVRQTRILLPPDSWSGLSSAKKLLLVTHSLAFDGDGEFDPAYITYPNDCTNFVSQGLKSAGWRTVGSGIDTQKQNPAYWGYWESDGNFATTTTFSWRVADTLYEHATTYSHRGLWIGDYSDETVLSHQSELVPGDLIFLVTTPGATNTNHEKDHVMVVVSVIAGIAYISQHNVNRSSISLAVSQQFAHEQGHQPRWYFVRT
jgi:hypothetical protein